MKTLNESHIPQIEQIANSVFEELEKPLKFKAYFAESWYGEELDLVIATEGLTFHYDIHGQARRSFGIYSTLETIANKMIEDELMNLLSE